MSDAPKSEARTIPKIGLPLGIGIGVGIAFALASLPNWRLVSGWIVFGVISGLTAGIVQARRLNRQGSVPSAENRVSSPDSNHDFQPVE
jgi:hypothetical protein